jgi:protein transport protein SEC24
MVGVATYDTSIHFYSLSPNQSQPHMLVMPDISDVYAPLSAPLVGRAAEVRETMAMVLQAIPTFFANTRITDACGAAAVEVRTPPLLPARWPPALLHAAAYHSPQPRAL